MTSPQVSAHTLPQAAALLAVQESACFEIVSNAHKLFAQSRVEIVIVRMRPRCLPVQGA